MNTEIVHNIKDSYNFRMIKMMKAHQNTQLELSGCS